MGVIPKYRKARIGLSNKELVFLVFGHTRHYQWYEKAASKSRLGWTVLMYRISGSCLCHKSVVLYIYIRKGDPSGQTNYEVRAVG